MDDIGPVPPNAIDGGTAYWGEDDEVAAKMGSGRVRINIEDSRLQARHAEEIAGYLIAASEWSRRSAMVSVE